MDLKIRDTSNGFCLEYRDSTKDLLILKSTNMKLTCKSPGPYTFKNVYITSELIGDENCFVLDGTTYFESRSAVEELRDFLELFYMHDHLPDNYYDSLDFEDSLNLLEVELYTDVLALKGSAEVEQIFLVPGSVVEPCFILKKGFFRVDAENTSCDSDLLFFPAFPARVISISNPERLKSLIKTTRVFKYCNTPEEYSKRLCSEPAERLLVPLLIEVFKEARASNNYVIAR